MHIDNDKLQRLTTLIKDVPGDFGEIGVWIGNTFKRLIPIAKEQGKEAHAYDSFIGMNNPSNKDLGQYPKGKYSVGGLQLFSDMMFKANFTSTDYKTFEGYIPECFTNTKPEQKYSFIYLDVDHYEATKIALPWCWEHLSAGGMLLLDDYFEGKKGLASLAIDEWLKNPTNKYNKLENKNTHLALMK